jgi:tetratricopeptide (TPR) repeat protein
MTHADTRQTDAHRRLLIASVLVATAISLCALGLHYAARAFFDRANAPGSLTARADSARIAAVLEPWNGEFARSARVLRLWATGQRLLDAGDYNGAVDTLREAYSSDIGNAELLALFKRAQATQALETNKKAHLQHGHEGPGGTLQPGDIER